LVLLGVVFAHTLSSSRSQAGYLTSNTIYSGSLPVHTGGLLEANFDCERPVEMLVPGIPPVSVDRECQNLSDDSLPFSPLEGSSGTRLCRGEGRPVPAEPSSRKGGRSSASDVAFSAVAAVPHYSAGRLPASHCVVYLLHPDSERLFRPPR